MGEELPRTQRTQGAHLPCQHAGAARAHCVPPLLATAARCFASSVCSACVLSLRTHRARKSLQGGTQAMAAACGQDVAAVLRGVGFNAAPEWCVCGVTTGRGGGTCHHPRGCIPCCSCTMCALRHRACFHEHVQRTCAWLHDRACRLRGEVEAAQRAPTDARYRQTCLARRPTAQRDAVRARRFRIPCLPSPWSAPCAGD